jgi:type IV pilus assembly protein PilB
VTRADIADIAFYEGAGCEECNYTGYRGRMGIFEFLKITEEICDLILERATTDDIHAQAVKQGMASLRQDGWVKTCMGLTTFSEVGSHTPSETPLSLRAAAKAEVLLAEKSVAELPGLV